MRKLSGLLMVIILLGCQSTPTITQCFASDEEASKWTPVSVSSEEALEMRIAAFADFKRDPLQPRETEYWFLGKNNNALLCEPSGRYGCETITWEIVKTAEGWKSRNDEMSIRLCH